MKRLNVDATTRIVPDKKITITYGGKSYSGVAGDTIATLLYANGVRVFSRSRNTIVRGDFTVWMVMQQYHDAGEWRAQCTGGEHLGQPGMVVKPQNVSMGKTADTDAMAFMDKMSFAMPAGFYYRTLHKPAKAWPVAIPKIRKAAGLGVLDPDYTMPGVFDELYRSLDVCVIGGGPAGLRVALAAAEQGLRVTLLEKRPWLGGHFEYRSVKNEEGNLSHSGKDIWPIRWWKIPTFGFLPIRSWWVSTTIISLPLFKKGMTDPFTQRYVEIRTKSLVVATGYIERPLLFEHNDRPGVMQVGCAHRLAKTWGILPGEKALFSIGDDLGLEAAIDLHDLGMTVMGVADIREDGQSDLLEDALSQRGFHSIAAGWPLKQKGPRR